MLMADLLETLQTFWPYFWVIGLFLAAFRVRSKEPVDILEFRWNGPKPFLTALVEGLLLGSLLGFISGWVGCSALAGESALLFSSDKLETGNLVAAVGALTFASGFTFNALLTARAVGLRPSPSFAVNQSRRNVLRLAGAGIGVGCLGFTIPLLFNLDKNSTESSILFVVATSLALQGWIGMFVALNKGGFFLLDHYEHGHF